MRQYGNDVEERHAEWASPRARDVTIGALTVSAVVHAALVAEHTDDLLWAAAFGGAAVATAGAAALLARPAFAHGPALAAALLASLLVAYPVVHVATGAQVQALDVATKVIEAVGLLAALRIEREADPSLAPLDVLVGVTIGVLLISVGGAHAHAA